MESIEGLLKNTHGSAKQLRRLTHDQKSMILLDLSRLLLENKAEIIAENYKDLERMDPSDPKYDRLLLNEKRIESLAASLLDVAKLEDPSGKILSEKTLYNGIKLEKVAVPMGVVGAIFESRPNVTIDVAALCIASGNGAILKGGKEADFSNHWKQPDMLTSSSHGVLRV
jgi:glutamate-5-semialdehyde dehydrogenase